MMEIHLLTKLFLKNNMEEFIAILKQDKTEYWTDEHFLSDLKSKWHLSFYATIKKKIVGYIIASQKENSVHIHKIFVHAQHKRKGIGSKLLYKLECNTVDAITLKVNTHNKNARAFYEEKGFQIVDANNEQISMKKKRIIVGIHQPNFMPWLGYFDKIKKSDNFVIIDHVQYVKNSIINRNRVLDLKNEKVWFTAPVSISKGSAQKINEIKVDFGQMKFLKKQINRLKSFYMKAPFFKEYFPEFETLLLEKHHSLAEKNIAIIKHCLDILEIETPISIASELGKDFGMKNDLNLNITKHFNGNTYLSGNGAKTYNDHSFFEQNNIALVYQKFNHPEYQQRGNDFVSHLSILDAIFFLGENIKNVL